MNETEWDEKRKVGIEAWELHGWNVTEPDTPWGSGIGNFPCLSGIAPLYIPHTRGEDGERVVTKVEPAKPREKNYMATKYDTEFTDRIEELLEGDYDDDMGSVDELGWYGRVEFDYTFLVEAGIVLFAKDFGGRIPVAAIISHDDRGFVGASYYFDDDLVKSDWHEDGLERFESDWKSIVEEYQKYWDEQETLEALEEEGAFK